MKTRAHAKEKKVALPGGGTRSANSHPFDLVPPQLLRRVADRFGLGAQKHGAWNWTKSIQTREDAYFWCVTAYNHMQEHVLKLGAEQHDDDHIGAIGWACAVIALVEDKYQCKWWELNDDEKFGRRVFGMTPEVE